MTAELRPAIWDDVVGHAGEIRRLRKMLALERLPHALLFAGPDGIGKRIVAEILAAQLLETDTAKLSAHPDFYAVKPEGLLISIGQIREIQRVVGLAAAQGRYRVCMIEQAECMEAPAANSILKTLEEPPPGMIFILITAFPHSLLTTLRSRSTLVRFSPLVPELVEKVLLRQGLQPSLAGPAARLGGGSCGTAMEMDSPLNTFHRKLAMDLLHNIRRKDQEWFWPMLSSVDDAETRQILEFIKQWIFVLRDLGLLMVHCPAVEPFNIDHQEELQALSANWDIKRIAAAIKIAEETRRSLQRNANARLMLESLFIRSVDLYWGGKMHANDCGGPV